MSQKFNISLLTCIISIQVLYAQQSWFLNQRTIIPFAGVVNQEIYFSGSLVKVQDIAYTLILDVSSHEMFFIMPDYLIYWKGPFEEVRKGYSSLKLEQVKEAVMLVHEKERELYKEFLSDRSNPAMKDEVMLPPDNIRIKKTAETATICGYWTEKYQVYAGQELAEEVFIAPALILGLGWYETIKLHQYLRIVALPFATNHYFFSKEYFALLNTGYPMKNIRYNRYVNEINEVTEVEKLRPGATSFEPDPEYKQISIAELLRMRDSCRDD